MFDIREKAMAGLGFLFVNLAAGGLAAAAPFYALTATMVPYNAELHKLSPMLYILNCCVCLLFLMQIIKRVDEQYCMLPYVLTRTSKHRAFLLAVLRLSGEAGVLVLVKMGADLLLSHIKACSDLSILLQFSASTFLTMLFWGLAVYGLRAAGVSAKAAFVGSFMLLALCQYAACVYAPFTLLALASPAFLATPILWLGGKLLLAGGCTLCLFAFYKYHQNKHSFIRTEGDMV